MYINGHQMSVQAALVVISTWQCLMIAHRSNLSKFEHCNTYIPAHHELYYYRSSDTAT